MQESISQRMAYLLDHDEPFAYCVITATMGSTPRRAGAAMIVTLDGTVTGSVGGGEVEKGLITAAQDALRERQARMLTFDPSAPGLTSCGGSMDVFIQVFSPPSRLCIFGAGHIGRALADLAAGLGFQVMLLDMDPDAGKKEPLRPGITRVSGSREELLVQCVPSPDTYFVIATSDHREDISLLGLLARMEHAYLGMLGSRKKVALATEALLSAGIPTELIEQIDMPIGLSIGARNPQEIAVSIAAKLIAHRNRTA